VADSTIQGALLAVSTMVEQEPQMTDLALHVFTPDASLADGAVSALKRPEIDPEFQSLIPPLASEELSQLEENLVEHGCRDPLVVWEETGFVVDGHNRLAICTRLNIPYQTVDISFSSRDSATRWIINNQLGRRNLSPDWSSVLRGRRYNLEKQALGGQIPGSRMDQNEPPIPTADRLAAEYFVSPATIKRAAKEHAGLTTILARVLHVDDLQARRLCATENLQRAGRELAA
jgi:hypothetical protein